jgi:hypothetical protein
MSITFYNLLQLSTTLIPTFQILIISSSLLAFASSFPTTLHHATAPYQEPEAIAPVYNYYYNSAHENRDNYNTGGGYPVNLPDGREQIVSYSAGPEGYYANVG